MCTSCAPALFGQHPPSSVFILGPITPRWCCAGTIPQPGVLKKPRGFLRTPLEHTSDLGLQSGPTHSILLALKSSSKKFQLHFVRWQLTSASFSLLLFSSAVEDIMQRPARCAYPATSLVGMAELSGWFNRECFWSQKSNQCKKGNRKRKRHCATYDT